MEKGNIIYCAAPRAGGIYAHYRALREGLAPLGWNVRAVSVGKGYWQDGFDDDGCVAIDADPSDAETAARALFEWCNDEHTRIVYMSGAEYSMPAWNMIRHAPSGIRAVSRAYASTLFSYRSALIHPGRLSALVATSKRQQEDIMAMNAVEDDRIHLIPHAVHSDFLMPAGRAECALGQPIRLGLAARLKDSEKGIFALPKILRELDRRGLSWSMEIVGDGPDEPELFRRFERHGLADRVVRRGRMARRQVAERMAEFDIFLMTSYHEGFGIAQIEAMASGAIPVVFQIPGVTDWIVEDGKSGFVVEQGDVKGMAEAVTRLDADRSLLKEMSAAARKAVNERFHPDKMARAYDALFTDILEEDFDYEPLPWSEFRAARFPRSRLNRLAHAIVPNSMRGRARRWADMLKKKNK